MHMTSIKITQFSRPEPSVHPRPKFFHPLNLRRPILDEISLPSLYPFQ